MLPYICKAEPYLTPSYDSGDHTFRAQFDKATPRNWTHEYKPDVLVHIPYTRTYFYQIIMGGGTLP